MRIFIKNIKLNDASISKLENKYFKKTKMEYYLYSDQGVYKFLNSKFVQLYPHDVPIISVDSLKYKFLIDKSYFNISNNCFYLPLDHIVVCKKVTSLNLGNEYSFTFEIERSYLNNKLVALLYYINTRVADFKIIESDLISFLSINKNIL